MNIGDKMYRYESYRFWDYAKSEDGHPTPSVEIHCTEFCVKKTTRCGYWVMRCGNGTNEEHFILDNARKKFAYKTKELALKAFIARKRRQVVILTEQLAVARETLLSAMDMEEKKS